MKIISQTERIEIKYENNIEQRAHEQKMVMDGYTIRISNKESQTIAPVTLFEKDIFNQFGVVHKPFYNAGVFIRPIDD